MKHRHLLSFKFIFLLIGFSTFFGCGVEKKVIKKPRPYHFNSKYKDVVITPPLASKHPEKLEIIVCDENYEWSEPAELDSKRFRINEIAPDQLKVEYNELSDTAKKIKRHRIKESFFLDCRSGKGVVIRVPNNTTVYYRIWEIDRKGINADKHILKKDNESVFSLLAYFPSQKKGKKLNYIIFPLTEKGGKKRIVEFYPAFHLNAPKNLLDESLIKSQLIGKKFPFWILQESKNMKKSKTMSSDRKWIFGASQLIAMNMELPICVYLPKNVGLFYNIWTIKVEEQRAG